MARSWFVQTLLKDGRTFLTGAANPTDARTKAGAIFTDGYSQERIGGGGDQKIKLHPLPEIKEITVFWEGEDD